MKRKKKKKGSSVINVLIACSACSSLGKVPYLFSLGQRKEVSRYIVLLFIDDDDHDDLPHPGCLMCGWRKDSSHLSLCITAVLVDVSTGTLYSVLCTWLLCSTYLMNNSSTLSVIQNNGTSLVPLVPSTSHSPAVPNDGLKASPLTIKG